MLTFASITLATLAAAMCAVDSSVLLQAAGPSEV